MSFLTNFFSRSKKNLIENIAPSAISEKPLREPVRGGTTLRKQKETLTPERKDGPELGALEMAERQNWEVKSLPVWRPGDEILGLYRIEQIMEGGMGRVYIAHHKSWNIKLAIKSPNEMMLSDRSNFARVLREAESWTELGLHPNIAYCYYVRSIEDVPHIFVEYVDGGNLRQRIEEGKCIDYRVSLDLAIQFCHGMEHAHSKGMIHRDIKPENILMTKDGMLKITDFGLVRAGAVIGGDKGATGLSAKGMTRLGDVMGTEGFMAPEQFTDAAGVDERADIFSFGVCLYEMCCGARPYDITIGEHKDAPDPVVLSRDEQFPLALAEVLRKCVQWERDLRYRSFQEIRERLMSIYSDLYGEENLYADLELINLKAAGLNNRAISYLELGREEDAVRSFGEALMADPHHLESTYNFGYFQWQNAEIADDVLVSRMKELEYSNRENTDYWRCLACIYLGRGDIDALEHIQQSDHSMTDPEFVRAYEDLNRPVGRLVRTFDGHTGFVYTVAISPDNRYALSGSSDKTLRIWEIDSGREIRCIEGHTSFVYSVAFSPDGKYALSGSDALKLWDIGSGRELRRFEGHTDDVTAVSFSPDGSYALSGSYDKSLRLWDIKSEKEIRRFDGHDKSILFVSFSPDGRYAVSGGKVESFRLWDIKSGKVVQRFNGHSNWVNCVAFSPDCRYVVSGSYDNTIRLWDINSGRELRRFVGHTDSVQSISTSPDGSYILSGSRNNIIRLHDIHTGCVIRSFEEHTGAVNSVLYSFDGKYALSGGSDYKIRLWNLFYPLRGADHLHVWPLLSSVVPVAKISAEKRRVESLLITGKESLSKGLFNEAYCFARQAQLTPGYERDRCVMDLLNMCGKIGKGRRVGLKGGWFFRKLGELPGTVRTVSFSPDGKYALSGGQSDTLRLWDIESGKEVRRFEEHTRFARTVSFSPDGRQVLSGGGDHHTFNLSDVESGKEIRRFEGLSMSVHSVAFSPDGKYALSGSEDRDLRLWDIESGKEVRRFEGLTSAVSSVSFSPDGRNAFSGGGYSIRVWDIESGKELCHIKEHASRPRTCSFSPDGNNALSGGLGDDPLRLWDIESGRELRNFEGCSDNVSSITFSPDGRYALTGSWDKKSLRLWDIMSGKELRCFESHTGPIASICFSPDGRYALSGSFDKTIRLWEFDWEWEFPDRIITSCRK
jgi:WD40 repeat protein/serine/threonine protein kinase